MIDICLIDDDTQDLLLLRRLLEQCKIVNPVFSFQSADEYFNHLEARQASSKSAPALIFLDLIMAPVSGLDVLQRWKSSALASHSIVVMMSGLRDLRAIQEGYQLGARTFLIKPVTKDDLLQTLSGLSRDIAAIECSGGYALHWTRSEPLPKGATAGKELRFVKSSG